AAWLVVAAAPPIRGAPGRDGEVKAVSVLPAPGRVEVVIDLRGAVEVQDFTLASPARLVLDLQGARLVAPAALYDGQNRGGIKNVRYAQFRPGVVRVVIDLDVLKDYQIERRDGQVRVKIGTDRTAFGAWSSLMVATLPPPPPPAPAPVAPHHLGGRNLRGDRQEGFGEGRFDGARGNTTRARELRSGLVAGARDTVHRLQARGRGGGFVDERARHYRDPEPHPAGGGFR